VYDIKLKRPPRQLILLNKLSSGHIFRLDIKPSSGHSVIREYRYFSQYGFNTSRILTEWMTVFGETSVKIWISVTDKCKGVYGYVVSCICECYCGPKIA